MKLLNQSIKYITISMMVVISTWALIFYFSIYNEIKKSVDEGLDNYKRQIVSQALIDSTMLENESFEDNFYSIKSIDKDLATIYRDTYIDTLIHMQDADDLYPELEEARMLSTAFEANNEYYELKVIHYMIEEDDLIKQLLWNTLWLFTVLLITVVLINNFLLQRLWKPFYLLLSKLKTYRLGYSKSLPEIKTNIKEFEDLKIAVNTLLKHNNEVFEQQKEFIGNVSHELQTPLAIAINKLELLIENENLSVEQVNGIGETMEIIEGLTRVNKSLLLLSKIENHQFVNEQMVSINQIVKQNIEELQDLADYKEISITLRENDNIEIDIDPTLANIIISNLIRNSIFHNYANGTVDIAISKNNLAICNTGDEVALDQKDLFVRFYKSKQKTRGTGLGLSIVQSICNIYKFKINYQYHNNKHCFELKFK